MPLVANHLGLLIAASVRAELARKHISQYVVAAALGLSQAAVSRRLAGIVHFSAPELAVIAGLTGARVEDLYPAAVALTPDCVDRAS
jgi:transcriptional regulator with XRE-family HTH domain